MNILNHTEAINACVQAMERGLSINPETPVFKMREWAKGAAFNAIKTELTFRNATAAEKRGIEEKTKRKQEDLIVYIGMNNELNDKLSLVGAWMGEHYLRQLNKLSWLEAQKRVDSWMKNKKRKEINERAEIGRIKALDGENGTWYWLTTEEALAEEGEDLRHCSRSYWEEIKSGLFQMASLRSSENKALMTAALRMHPSGIGGFSLSQARCFANSAPPKKYEKDLVLLMDHVDERWGVEEPLLIGDCGLAWDNQTNRPITLNGISEKEDLQNVSINITSGNSGLPESLHVNSLTIGGKEKSWGLPVSLKAKSVTLRNFEYIDCSNWDVDELTICCSTGEIKSIVIGEKVNQLKLISSATHYTTKTPKGCCGFEWMVGALTSKAKRVDIERGIWIGEAKVENANRINISGSIIKKAEIVMPKDGQGKVTFCAFESLNVKGPKSSNLIFEGVRSNLHEKEEIKEKWIERPEWWKSEIGKALQEAINGNVDGLSDLWSANICDGRVNVFEETNCLTLIEKKWGRVSQLHTLMKTDGEWNTTSLLMLMVEGWHEKNMERMSNQLEALGVSSMPTPTSEEMGNIEWARSHIREALSNDEDTEESRFVMETIYLEILAETQAQLHSGSSPKGLGKGLTIKLDKRSDALFKWPIT